MWRIGVLGLLNCPYMAGRPSRLSDPAFLKRVAACFYAGLSRESMCVELEVKDPDTITRWRRDPRVKAIVGKLNEDRALQISRRVDATIAGRLSKPENLKIEDLIRIRKEYGGAAVGRKEIADDDTVADAMEKLAEDPGLADKLRELLEGKPEPALVDATESPFEMPEGE